MVTVIGLPLTAGCPIVDDQGDALAPVMAAAQVQGMMPGNPFRSIHTAQGQQQAEKEKLVHEFLSLRKAGIHFGREQPPFIVEGGREKGSR